MHVAIPAHVVPHNSVELKRTIHFLVFHGIKLAILVVLGFICLAIGVIAYQCFVNGMDVQLAITYVFTGVIPDGAKLRGLY